MSQHHASILWQRATHADDHTTYSRNHVARLNGGQTVNVSAAVNYKGDSACADPEQLMISAVASCHMLTFLAIAEFQGYTVEQYEDNAVGHLEKGEGSGLSVTRIVLSPRITFGGDKIPDAQALTRIHATAHKNCFIANSLKTTVTIAATPDPI